MGASAAAKVGATRRALRRGRTLALLAFLSSIALYFNAPFCGAMQFGADPPQERPYTQASLLGCTASLRSRSPWLSFYGDSVARGVFFDLVSLANGTVDGETAHPGHSANYSVACALIEERPPLRRPKCGAFEYAVPIGSTTPGRLKPLLSAQSRFQPASLLALPAQLEAQAGQGVSWSEENERMLRLSFRLKSFTWEPDFDEPWLRGLRHAPRLPDVIVLSSGLWDMLYPPDLDPLKGVAAFNRSLTTFVSSLLRSLSLAGSRIGQNVRNASPINLETPQRDLELRGPAPRPRLVWMSVGAISEGKLPQWKRTRMTAALSAEYNVVAANILRDTGIHMVDVFSTTAAKPHLSSDGVHYPGRVSKQIAQAVIGAICTAKPPTMPEQSRRHRRLRRIRLAHW